LVEWTVLFKLVLIENVKRNVKCNICMFWNIFLIGMYNLLSLHPPVDMTP